MSNSPEAANVLSSFLRPCRLVCRRTRLWRLSAPFGLEFAKAGPGFLIVVEGTCRLRHSASTADLSLARSDFTLFTRGTAFTLCDRQGSRVVAADHLLDGAGSAARELFPPVAGPEAVRLAWGSLDSDDHYTRQALALLPPVLVARGDGPDAAGLSSLTRLMLDELDGYRPGGQLLADRLLHALLVFAVRATPIALPETDSLIPALNIPGMGAALAAMHERPQHEWSVRELAGLAGLSRSKFAVRFVEVFGCPPFDYLRDVRMRLACQLLQETDQGIREIAAQAGYATEASFSRAFSQWCGSAPGVYRRQQKAQPLERARDLAVHQ